MDKGGAGRSRVRYWIKPALLIFLPAALIVIVGLLGVWDRLGELREWIHGLGPWGPAVYVLVYILVGVSVLPAAPMTAVGGALFGALWGTVLASVSATAGAGAAFLVARYLARDAVAKWLRDERFHKLDRMIREHGDIVVGLARLVQVLPYNVLNYAFGLTRVPFRTYLFWSWLCMIPGTIIYAAGADAVYQTITRGEAPWPAVIATISTLVILILMIRRARRRLRQKEERADGADDNATGVGA